MIESSLRIEILTVAYDSSVDMLSALASFESERHNPNKNGESLSLKIDSSVNVCRIHKAKRFLKALEPRELSFLSILLETVSHLFAKLDLWAITLNVSG